MTISQESMNEFAEIVAAKIEAATISGTKSGYKESTQEIIKDQIRNTNLTLKKAV